MRAVRSTTLIGLVATSIAGPLQVCWPSGKIPLLIDYEIRAPEDATVDLVSTRSEWIYLKDKRTPAAAPDRILIKPREDSSSDGEADVDLVSTRSEWIYLRD